MCELHLGGCSFLKRSLWRQKENTNASHSHRVHLNTYIQMTAEPEYVPNNATNYTDACHRDSACTMHIFTMTATGEIMTLSKVFKPSLHLLCMR